MPGMRNEFKPVAAVLAGALVLSACQTTVSNAGDINQTPPDLPSDVSGQTFVEAFKAYCGSVGEKPSAIKAKLENDDFGQIEYPLPKEAGDLNIYQGPNAKDPLVMIGAKASAVSGNLVQCAVLAKDTSEIREGTRTFVRSDFGAAEANGINMNDEVPWVAMVQDHPKRPMYMMQRREDHPISSSKVITLQVVYKL